MVDMAFAKEILPKNSRPRIVRKRDMEVMLSPEGKGYVSHDTLKKFTSNIRNRSLEQLAKHQETCKDGCSFEQQVAAVMNVLHALEVDTEYAIGLLAVDDFKKPEGVA